jgi:hypothetical protein
MNIFVLEAGQSPLDLFPCGSAGTFVYSRSSPSSRWPEICKTLRRLDNESFDLAVVSYREKSFFPKGAGWMRGLGQALRSFLFRPDELTQLLMFSKLVQKNIPIALINRSDSGHIPLGSDWFYRRSHACFVRELYPAPEILLQDIFTSSGGNLQSNRRAQKILSLWDPHCPRYRNVENLRPISLGISDSNISKIPSSEHKIWDLFFAGDLHEKSLRTRLVQECRQFEKAKGLKFLITDRISQSDYLQALSESRLCLSPPGMGWDCWRHYEAMLAGSIPLMTYPTILQHHPAIDGKHCFYFAPEPGGLTRALEHALLLKSQLPQMADAGRQLVLKHHTFSKLREYVIRETLSAFTSTKSRDQERAFPSA